MEVDSETENDIIIESIKTKPGKSRCEDMSNSSTRKKSTNTGKNDTSVTPKKKRGRKKKAESQGASLIPPANKDEDVYGDEWVVEKVVGKKKDHGIIKYCIKWQDWPE